MKKTFKRISVLVLALLCLGDSATQAEPFKANPFFSGELLSAIRLNDLWQEIIRIQGPVKVEELLGSWSCDKFIFANATDIISGGDPNYYQAVDADQLWHTLKLELEFFQNPQGAASTYAWSSENYNAFAPANFDHCTGSGKVSVYGGKLGVTAPICGTPDTEMRVLDVQRPSPTRLIFQQRYSNSVGAIRATMLCDKADISPTAPDALAAVLLGEQVTLTWSGTSNNQEGYRVYRRDSLEGEFVEISSLSPSQENVILTLPSSGTFWFGVRAFNANGISFMSNVVKVEALGAEN